MKKLSKVGTRRCVIMTRELEGLNININPNITVKELEQLYHKKTKKNPPSYNKISVWLEANPIERIRLRKKMKK